MRLRTALALVASLLSSATAVAQESPAQRLTEQARKQIQELNTDSAHKLLSAALTQARTDAERVRAFTLLGIAELDLGRQPAARQAFERALRIDPRLQIDSLAELSADVRLVFAQARTVVGNPPAVAERAADPPPRVPLAVTVNVAQDTTLSVDSPRLQAWVQPNARARVTAAVLALDMGNRGIFDQSFMSDARQTRVVEWALRGPDGSLMAPGRYLLRVQATDSATGETAPTYERTLVVVRAQADTQPHPPALPATAFAPERSAGRGAKPRTLVIGTGLAALIVVTPMVMGNTTLNSGLSGDPTSFVVAGGVAVGSVVGFLRGQRGTVLTENVKKNQQLRDDDRKRRDAIIAANATARSRAPLRVTIEGGR